MAKPDLTAFETTEIQMRMVVPLLRDLQAILGEDVVIGALEERVRLQIAAAREHARRDVPFEKRTKAIAREFARFGAGDVLEYASGRRPDGGLAIDVSACRYAELMEELDARDLGSLLLCAPDEAAAAAAGTRLERTQTRMQGASHCDFRFCDACTEASAR